jgi:hypothetical protein
MYGEVSGKTFTCTLVEKEKEKQKNSNLRSKLKSDVE